MTYLRPLRLTDIVFCYRIGSDPVARAYSHDPNLPTPIRHVRYFIRNLRNPLMWEWAIVRNGKRVGIVTLRRRDYDALTVGVNLTEEARGAGLGSTVVGWAARWAEKRGYRTVAEILPNNGPSLRAFAVAGYVERERTEKRVTMTYMEEAA